MVLSGKHVRVVGPIVVPQTRQLLQEIGQVLGFRTFQQAGELVKPSRETGKRSQASSWMPNPSLTRHTEC